MLCKRPLLFCMLTRHWRLSHTLEQQKDQCCENNAVRNRAFRVQYVTQPNAGSGEWCRARDMVGNVVCSGPRMRAEPQSWRVRYLWRSWFGNNLGLRISTTNTRTLIMNEHQFQGNQWHFMMIDSEMSSQEELLLYDVFSRCYRSMGRMMIDDTSQSIALREPKIPRWGEVRVAFFFGQS